MSDQVSSRPLSSNCGLQNLPASLSYLIAIRAHELYERRCKQDGYALEELQAESEIVHPLPLPRDGRLVGVR